MLPSAAPRLAAWLRAAYSSTARMRPQVEAPEYASRREALARRIRNAAPSNAADRPLLIVSRAAQRYFSAPDVPYPFRQCSYFRYLTGFLQPSGLLAIVQQPGKRPIARLYVEARTPQQELWEGPGMSVSDIMAVSGVDEVLETKHFATDVEKLVEHAIVSFDVKQFSSKSDPLCELLASCNVMVPLREHVDALRWVKSSREQALMRKSCDIGARSMNAMISKCRGVSKEAEIVGRLELETRRRGAAYLAYPPVVAAGSRANTIHYLDANHDIDEKESVLVDAGCDFEGYASDITRVFPAHGEFTEPQRTLLDALNDVQSQLLAYANQVRPVKLNDLYLSMVQSLAKNLLEVGLFPKDISQQKLIYEADKICPHHVSHYLGLDVHDTATVPRSISVQPGVVFTIEPGVYVRKENDVARAEFRGLGMRVEDDVLLTETGCEVLTAGALRQSAHIEELMRL